MRSKLTLLLITALLASCLLAGCQSGVPQELYDEVLAQFNAAQAKIDEARGNISQMEAERDALLADLKSCRDESAELAGQIAGLKEQYELTGATPAETAEKIVRYYYDTHEYSKTDMFTCGDMAAEVWNMLKRQGIAVQ